MPEENLSELELFLSAVEIQTEADRAEFLKAACQGSAELERRVHELLQHHLPDDGFLETAPAGLIDEETLTHLTSNTLDDDSLAKNSQKAVSSRLESLSELQGFLGPSEDAAAIGTLPGYLVTDVLGVGGMGVVLKGRDLRLGREVAIKFLSPDMLSRQHGRERFLREARAAAAISSPHVITVYSVLDDPSPYIAMEFINGENLASAIARGAPPLQEVLRIATAIAEGLAAAHDLGIVHRDINPTNILIDRDTRQVKIADFGIARMDTDVTLTSLGDIAGTPQFMSPEQIQGEAPDARSDLFSFGATIYALCSGSSPFSAGSMITVLRNVCDKPHRPLNDVNPDIPVWLSEFVDRLLAKRREDRIPSAKEVLKQLEAFQQRLDSEMTTNSSTRNPERRFLPTTAWVVFVLIAVLIGMESFGITQMTATILRMAAGKGTLIVEVNDPEVAVSIENDGVRLQWDGQELRLTPGDYFIQATRAGEPVQQEIITVRRGRDTVFSVRLEPVSKSAGDGSADEDRNLAGRNIGPFSNPPDWRGWAPNTPAPAVVPFSSDKAAEFQQAWADYLGVPVEFTNSQGTPFRLIPPGEFLMGMSEKDYQFIQEIPVPVRHPEAFNRVHPQHPVRLTKPFYMAQWEVRHQDYEELTGHPVGTEEELSSTGHERGHWPILSWCSWLEAVEFCNALSLKEGKLPCYAIDDKIVSLTPNGNGYRLPTEAEWEFACRGGTDGIFFHGLSLEHALPILMHRQDPETLELFGQIRDQYTLSAWDFAAAQTFDELKNAVLPNPFGLFQMHGSANEHCWDRDDPLYYRLVPQHQFTIDPLGSDSLNVFTRVRRGGAWAGSGNPWGDNSVDRNPLVEPSEGSIYVGFGRLVIGVESAKPVTEPK